MHERRHTVCAAALLATLLAGPPAAAAGRYAGVVSRVVDGDTLILRYLEHHVSVRLEHVEAPETGAPYGEASAKSLAQLCERRNAEVMADDTDEYGRVVGEVLCVGVSANAEQLRRGMGTLDDAAAAPPAWRRLQAEARSAKRGLWAGDAHAAPH